MTGERGAAPSSGHSNVDPGAYVGNEPEFEAETIPGGVRPDDERVAAYGSRSGVDGEPDAVEEEDQGDSSDVVEGPIGAASLRDPSETDRDGAGADLDRLPGFDGVPDPS